jgi:hypothetical protein
MISCVSVIRCNIKTTVITLRLVEITSECVAAATAADVLF